MLIVRKVYRVKDGRGGRGRGVIDGRGRIGGLKRIEGRGGIGGSNRQRRMKEVAAASEDE